jgi:hypothetical protein
VTTRRFLGSTAPTATSGVSIIAISRGGAVSMAARPKRAARPGEPPRPPGLIGVPGVRGLGTCVRGNI